MHFTIYSSNSTGSPQNTAYENTCHISTAEDLKEAVKYDYVCAGYANNRRKNDNFLSADCLPADCDNDHSENPADWITPADIQKAFPNVAFAVHYSRNNMKEKNGRKARPKFHVLFPIREETDVHQYAKLKELVYEMFPFFDNNALDAARFFFGTPDPQVDFFEGIKTLSEYIYGNTITEGSRNTTMSRYAGRILKRFGDSEETYNRFLQMSKRCDPPLDDKELNSIWRSALKFFHDTVSQQEGYIPPEKYNNPYDLKPDDYSDIGEGRILAREYKDELVYTDATDYMRWDGTKWVESKQLSIGACEEFLDTQLEEAGAALEKMRRILLQSGVSKTELSAGGKRLEKAVTDRNSYNRYLEAKQYYDFVMKRRDMKYVTSTLQAAKPMLLDNIANYDNEEFLLNTPAGVVDLRSGAVIPHNPIFKLTKITGASPDRKNEYLWLDALSGFFCNDKDLMEYVQLIAGLCAVGKVHVEELIISYGEGSNGKSTFWNSIAHVLGNYSGMISADALTVGCRRNVKPEMAELKGKRLVIAAELEEGMRLNTSTVKQLCSTDDIVAEKKYKDPFRFTPTHSLILYTNHLPRVGALDDGTWRRINIIPFKAKIEGTIKNYSDYLVRNAGGAILTWIIEGAQKVIDVDFVIEKPACVKEAISKYKENNNWLKSFIEECCEVDKSYCEKSGDLYQAYRDFCTRTGDYTRSTTDFYAGLEIFGFEKRRLKTYNAIQGIQLKSDFLEDNF